MSESKEEVVSIKSRPSHDPHAGYLCSPRNPNTSESEDEEATTDLAVAVPPYITINRSAPDLHTPDDPNIPPLNRPRVRFRSRVRISKGIGRRRRLSEGLSSNASSISGSPSSSISAPLRTQYTGSNNGWGPLGTRVSLLASHGAVPIPPRGGIYKSNGDEGWDGNRLHPRDGFAPRKATRRSNSRTVMDDEPHARTPLMTPAQRRRAAVNGYMRDYYDDVERERRWREQLMDEAFGKWPGRLLNRHWWWWQLEPIVCCFCICGDLDEGE